MSDSFSGVIAVKMTYGKSEYEREDGKFLARFDRVELRDATGQKDQRGNLMPPPQVWLFTLLEGPEAGMTAEKMTGRAPTPKSGCGRMLAGIADQVLKDGAEVEVDQFYGKTYRITIIEGKVSDAPAPQRIYDQTNATSTTKKPPPPSTKAKPAEPADDSQWQLYDDNQGEYIQMTGKEVRAFLSNRKVAPTSVHVAPPGSDETKTAAEYGFADIPF